MFKKKQEKIHTIGNYTINEKEKVKKKTINSIKATSDYIYVDSNSKITLYGDFDKILCLFSILCKSLLHVASKEELKKIIDITNKIKITENDEQKNEAFYELKEIVDKVYEKNKKKIQRGEDISIK